ncbi:MAG: peptidase S1 [Glycocaulis sp.]
MIARTVACAAFAALAMGAAASAQNYSLNPNFGTFSLNAGFLPDPYTVNVVAGGNINANRLGSGCVGSISDAPDVRLNFNGGRISIGAESNSDTTIVVNGPDGRWYCNDDFDGLNPRVTLSGSGQYDIWVGTYSGGTAQAVVYFTEY